MKEADLETVTQIYNEAIISLYSVTTPKQEFDSLKDLLDASSTNFIKYNDVYYEIIFGYGD